MARKNRVLDRLPGRRRQFRTALGWNLLNGALLIAEAWAVAAIVNEAFLGEGDWPSLWLPLALLLGIVLLRGLTHGAGESAALGQALKMKGELRQAAADKLAALGPQFAKGERSGELIHAVTEGLDQLETYFARYIPQLAQSMFIPVAILVAVVGPDLFSAIVLAVTMPLLILFMILVGKTAGWKAKKQYRLLGRLSGHLFDVLRGLYTLTVFNRSKDQIDVIARMSEAHRKATMSTLRLAFLSAFVMELFATLSTAVVAVFLGLRLIDGVIGFEAAFFVLLLAPEYYQPVRSLGTQFHASQNGVAAAERIFELLDAEVPGYPEREDGKVLEDRPEGYRIVLDRVTVQYPGADRPALSNVSLVLEPGQRVAVVGQTGAGKSTLIELLQGFVRPSEGRITVDGVDMAELSMAWWRSRIAVLSQQVRLFPGTVRDNLLLAKPGAADDELWAALKDAQADNWVNRLPQGLDTPLGEAVRLSGGQIQRIGLARALLKNAPVVLLDEPTSGLDRETEEAVRQMMTTRLSGRQTVTVAHRLETIRAADRIIVVADGQIREDGSPETLLQSGGLYADMVHAGSRQSGITQASAQTVQAAGQPVQVAQTVQASIAQAEDRAAAAMPNGGKASADSDQPIAESPERLGATVQPGGAGRSTLHLLLGFLRPFKGRMLLAWLLGSLTVAASVGLMATSGYLISKAALRPENVLLLWIPIVGVRFFGISRGVFRYLERLVSHDLTFRVLHRIRVWIYARVEPRGALLLEEERSGDLLDAMVRDVDQLQNLYLRVLAPPLIAVLIAGLGFGIAAVHHPLLGLTLLGMMLLAGIGIPLASHLLGRQAGVRYVRAKADLATSWADFVGGVAELILFGRVQDALDGMAAVGARADGEQAKQNRLLAWFGGAMVFLMRLAMWLVLALSVWLAGDGRIEPIFIASLVVTVLACFEAIIPLPEAFQYYGQTVAAADRLIRMTEKTAAGRGAGDGLAIAAECETDQGAKRATQQDVVRVAQQQTERSTRRDTSQVAEQQTERPTRRDSSQGAEQGSGTVVQPPGGSAAPAVQPEPVLQVRDLSYRYHPDEPYALQGLSLTLRPGRKIAVVGESGAGKSTFLHLLLRLRSFEEGGISLSGTDIREMPEERVRDHFAVVSQQVQLFNATVEDNLRLANPEASLGDMREAARLALIDDTIMALPDGYRTVIGEWGSRLSGGERQRLALARALLKDAPFILFDEPAAGLDPLTERALVENLQHRLGGKGVLWITHKLTGMDLMDEIIVLHGGTVAERGTEAELLARRERYFRFRMLEERFGV